VLVDPVSPLGTGAGRFNWVFYDFDLVMTASDPEHVAVSFPAASSDDFFISGFGQGHEELGETAAVVDEPAGDGRVVLFSTDPNFRAWTIGAQRFLRNAILAPDSDDEGDEEAGSPGRAEEEAEAKDAARAIPALDSPIRISVRPGSARETSALLERFGARAIVRRLPGKVSFLIANPRGLEAEEHPYVLELAAQLRRSRAEVIAFRAP
jgi:hypothetical protein